MKINQVEELAGIAKKNIRFYEEEGLLTPGRNPANGYREYSLEDVALLKKIRLLRKLSVPIGDIRDMAGGTLSLGDCLERRLAALNREEESLKHTRLICRMMQDDRTAFDGLDAARWLDQMETLEEGGTQFMNVEQTDLRKRKLVPVIAAAVTIAVMLAFLAAFWWLNQLDPAPAPVLVIITVMPVLVMIGVVAACRERLKEIEGGEENEALKY